MPFGREQFIVEKEMNGEVIEKVYAKELIPTPIEEFEKLSDEEKMLHKPYAFNQRTYEVMPGIICEQDVAVEMRDGAKLYCDIFRPADDTVKVPAILAWSNYGKRPNEFRPDELKAYTPGVPAGSISNSAKFEAADPEYWVPNGYAVINVDIRGIGYSDGYHDQFGEQDGQDGLHAAREAPPAVDGGGGEDGGSRKQDVPEIDAIARYAVAEAKTEGVPEQAARDDRERRGVRPDDRHVGQAEKPRAEEAVVDAERPGGERKGAARPGIAPGHVMVVPGDDGHDCGADEHADRRTERSRLRQEHGSGHDERAPADGRSKRERPGGERREMSREKRLLHLNPPNNARRESQENFTSP